MKKALQKKEAASVSLGTKRACPECGTKIYDFNRPELTCPKCERTFTPDEAPTKIPLALLKRSKATEKADGELAAQTDVLSSDETVDSADGIAVLDSDDDVAEDVTVDDDDDDDDDDKED